jgi:hypothetical protein
MEIKDAGNTKTRRERQKSQGKDVVKISIFTDVLHMESTWHEANFP